MKTLAIATIIGTVILYIFLAVVHTALAPVIHESDFKYTQAEESILSALSSSNLEDGMYRVPYFPPGTPMKDFEKMMKDRMGKPWADVSFHSQMTMSINVYIMSFIYNLISVLIICIALAAASNRLTSFGQRLWFVLLFALFVIFSNIMMGYNWYEIPMHNLKGQIIDEIGGFFFVGLWLAWYYGRVAARRNA